MLELVLAIGFGVVAWLVLKALRGGSGAGGGMFRAGRVNRNAAPPSWPEPPDPVSALQELPRRLYIEYRAPEGGVSRREVDVESLERQEGHLYLTGYCHLAKDNRSFRADRIAAFTDRHNNAIFKGPRAVAALEAASDKLAAQGDGAQPDAATAQEAEEAAARLRSERARALAAFREWAGRDDWVLMACNASGRGADAEFIEIAVVSAAGEVLFQQPVLPKGPISAAATAAHGLTAESLRGAAIWPRLHRDVIALLTAAPYVLSYNALFHLRILEQTAARYDLKLPPLEFDCVMQAYAAYRAEADESGQARLHSLDDAADHEGIAVEREEANGALAAALLTWRLIGRIGKGA